MYAQGTAVSVERSQMEIERMVRARGAKTFYRGSNDDKATVAFELADRKILFELPMPQPSQFEVTELARGKKRRNTPEQQEALAHQAERRQWRALVLAVKAKLVSVDSKIETLEEAFLAQIVVPHEGRAARFYDVVKASISDSYKTGRPMLLPGEAPTSPRVVEGKVHR